MKFLETKQVSAPYLTLSTIIVAALLLSAVKSEARIISTEKHNVQIVEIVSGLENPWGMAFLPDGRILVTERPGRLRIVKDGQLVLKPVTGLPSIASRGQGGLLDITLHPRFSENQLVYFSFTAQGKGGVSTEVARGKLVGQHLENVEVVFRQFPKSNNGRHFGSRLVFDRNEYLYITLGDRGQKDRAQRPDDHAGSVIRLHDDGRVPADNPFVEQDGWKPEKFTLGNRNIQGAALHPQTGEVWTNEHGPQGGDEINIIRAGTNYGWPVITYGVNYVIGTQIGEGTHKPGMAQPLYYWVPSIAPSGMTFYSGDRFSHWRGNLFVSSLKDRMLVRLSLKGDKVVREERFLSDVIGRIRDVCEGPDGFLYVITDEREGVLARLEPVD
jgi:glucose/arabinose dehydrogenase